MGFESSDEKSIKVMVSNLKNEEFSKKVFE